jgi:hypothetical protein
MTWRLDVWCDDYAKRLDKEITPMTRDEQNAAVTYLRTSKYEKPEDCPGKDCPMKRPACSLGICKIAVGLCGDF